MPTIIGTKIRRIINAYTHNNITQDIHISHTTHTYINTYTYRFTKYLKNESKE